jgi:hypothetical protein
MNVTDIGQEPVGYVTKVSNGNLIFTDGVPMNKESVPVYYAHQQPDQTALINQLTDELNKTEAERVRWMTMALTSSPKPNKEPLSDAELGELCKSLPLDTREGSYSFKKGFRQAEKAHGIGA